MRFARRTVTYSDVAIRKGPSRNILMPLEVEQVWTSVWHTQRKSPEVRLGGIQTLGLSLVSLVRYDLFIVAAWNKLEDVDGLPLITASTTRLPFIHVRSVGNQTAYSEDDHVNSVAPGTSSGWEEPWGTKADQEELQCHHSENPWKPMKTMENMGCPVGGGFDNRCKLCSNWGTLSTTCWSMSLSKLLYKLTMLVEWGLHRFARRTVT